MWRIPESLLFLVAFGVLFLSVHLNSYSQSSDEAQIRELEHRFAEAFKTKDVDAIMANYEHSGDLVFFDVVPRTEHLGWDSYKKDWEGLFAALEGPIQLFEIHDLRVNVGGDLAYSSSFQRHIYKTKAGGLNDATVRVTDVYRKNGGTWRIVQEHVSVPVDLRTGKAELQLKQ